MKTKTTLPIKKITFLIYLSLLQNLISAQTWQPLNGQSSNGVSGVVNAIKKYKNDIYIAGSFGHAGGNIAYSIAKWDGNTWGYLGLGISNGSSNANVNAMEIYSNELYIGGYFNTAGGNNSKCITKWDGSNWHSILSPSTIGVVFSSINTFYVHNSELYVGGNIIDTSNSQNLQLGILKWNGSNWSKIGNGVNSGQVNTITAFNNEIYVAGQFAVGGNPTSSILKWNGSNWISTGSNNFGPLVNVLKVFNNTLYAGVDLTTINPLSGIYKYNGSSWSIVNSGIIGNVKALHVSNGNLYTGGNFLTISGNPGNNIAKWDGNNWFPVSIGMNNQINAIDELNGEIYAGGHFDTADNNSANHVARWINSVGIIDNNSNQNIFLFPNPTTGYLTIDLKEQTDEVTVKIKNILGQEIFSKTYASTNLISLDVDGDKGIYFIEVENELGERSVMKVVKN